MLSTYKGSFHTLGIGDGPNGLNPQSCQCVFGWRKRWTLLMEGVGFRVVMRKG